MEHIVTKKEYQEYVNKKSPNSNIFINIFYAFIFGGFICDIGQFLIEIFKANGLSQDTISSLVSIIMIALGAILTGLNIYNKIGKYAGAGSIVPITGFANSIVSPAIEFKSEGFIMGLGAKMFIVAGPVLVYGITSSVIMGFIYYLFNMK